jgi:hypothetical protein
MFRIKIIECLISSHVLVFHNEGIASISATEQLRKARSKECILLVPKSETNYYLGYGGVA